jgi:hypothetical protein
MFYDVTATTATIQTDVHTFLLDTRAQVAQLEISITSWTWLACEASFAVQAMLSRFQICIKRPACSFCAPQNSFLAQRARFAAMALAGEAPFGHSATVTKISYLCGSTFTLKMPHERNTYSCSIWKF